ncbi:MAG: hypothetical protein ABIP58_01250 [Dehalococcoidia bacterium]
MTRDTMIQDVDSLNARIYFDGFMYVGGPRHMSGPSFFAPYFTKECERDTDISQIVRSGISYYSPVIVACPDVSAAKLVSPTAALSEYAPPRPHRDRWIKGLEEICRRCDKEKWSPEILRPLYFLDEPVPLGRTIRKDAGMGMIAPGFGTAFNRLSTANSVMGLTIR